MSPSFNSHMLWEVKTNSSEWVALANCLVQKWACDTILANEKWGEAARGFLTSKRGFLFGFGFKFMTLLHGWLKPTSGLPVMREFAWLRHSKRFFISNSWLKISWLIYSPNVLPRPFDVFFFLNHHQCFHLSLNTTLFILLFPPFSSLPQLFLSLLNNTGETFSIVWPAHTHPFLSDFLNHKVLPHLQPNLYITVDRPGWI